MKRRSKTKPPWTCKKCFKQHANRRLRICPTCKAKRPAKRRAAHMKALDIPYEDYVKLNGGEFCGICGKKPSAHRRLDRDHDHKTGKPRGLLCGGNYGCNKRLGRVDDKKWLESALLYLRRSEGIISEA
jgi:hypothetical protein